jgi:hypothetical protein
VGGGAESGEPAPPAAKRQRVINSLLSATQRDFRDPEGDGGAADAPPAAAAAALPDRAASAAGLTRAAAGTPGRLACSVPAGTALAAFKTPPAVQLPQQTPASRGPRLQWRAQRQRQQQKQQQRTGSLSGGNPFSGLHAAQDRPHAPTQPTPARQQQQQQHSQRVCQRCHSLSSCPVRVQQQWRQV